MKQLSSIEYLVCLHRGSSLKTERFRENELESQPLLDGSYGNPIILGVLWNTRKAIGKSLEIAFFDDFLVPNMSLTLAIFESLYYLKIGIKMHTLICTQMNSFEYKFFWMSEYQKIRDNFDFVKSVELRTGSTRLFKLFYLMDGTSF